VDIVPENARAFADSWGIRPEFVFEDTREMLDTVQPDIVSVCVPPHVHGDVVLSIVEHRAPDAIHCEKPIATTWADCREMVSACDRAGVQLTFNHQRRFGRPFRRAKGLVEDGRIGELRRIELGGKNLYDYGSHLFDICGYITDQTPVDWVMAGIDYSEENVQFGAHNENQAIAQWRYEDGVFGLASTGEGDQAGSILPCQMRLLGEEGIVEIGGSEAPLRVLGGGGWRTVDTGRDGIHGPRTTRVDAAVELIADRVPFLSSAEVGPPSFIDRAIEDVVTAVDADRDSELAAENAVQTTELIFACWESVRRQARVDLPLDIDDNPLEAMVDDGTLLASEE
jgi:predicted dehydrogenase